jgi:hypothetical protein
MSRRFVAAAWITGTTIPLLAAAAFFFACCVLPFHGKIHDLMPGCELAAHLMYNGPEVDEQKAQPPSTAPEKQEPIKRLATDLSSGVRIPVLSYEQRPFFATASGAYRSLITLGALRCDQDVGLHVLVKTFLI